MNVEELGTLFEQKSSSADTSTVCRKLEPMTTDDSLTPRFSQSRGLRVLRVVVFGVGLATIHMFFFSFIALIIGVVLFFLPQKLTWRSHGLAMASAAGVSAFAAHTGTGMSPLKLAFFYGTVPVLGYLVLYYVLWWWTRRTGSPQVLSKIYSKGKSIPKRAKAPLMILVVLVPVGLWWVVDINLGVMFDNEPRLLWVHAPSTVDQGMDFNVTVEAWDAYERLSATYKGHVQFSTESYNLTTYAPLTSVSAVLPESYTFTGQAVGSDIAYEIRDGKDNGRHVFTARIDTPGFHYILVEDSTTGNIYYTNPIMVTDLSDTDLRIYWGDIHGHTELSDGTGSPEHSFYFARYVACIDFCSLTDHGEIMLFIPGALDTLERATNAAYDPGDFVTFHGIEWTNVDPGHYTCIFSGNQLIKTPVLSYLTVPTTDTLWQALDSFTAGTDSRALALPHHTTQNAYIQDWTYINPKYVKIAEVTSVHGEFLFEQRHTLNYIGAIDPPPEYLNGSSIVDAFRMGYRMTLYASSDQHDGHPGHSLSHTPAFVGHQRPWSIWQTRNEHPYPGGLVAVHATNLTRESVFSALENQVIFANSDHGRPILDFAINGTGVGNGSTLYSGDVNAVREISVFLVQDPSPAGARSTAASVTAGWAPDWSATIEVIKNGDLFMSIPVEDPVTRVTVLDTTPITGTSYSAESCVQRDGQYYINDYSDNPVNPDDLNTSGADFYIVRVVGENGRITYAGPIWVVASS
ncbi:MAG: DUF3604 domain-containing protein [Candidatus Thorarchaeota archaeon]|nr:MAG: DUF3604 domain-containing protein [Candidatus Thorarchaeota archaeon]